MNKIVKIFFGSLIYLSMNITLADTIDCKDLKIISVTVEGPRDDGFVFQNKLIIQLNGLCAGKQYMHADLNHPAFDGFLSVALTAKTLEKFVKVAVNTSSTTFASNQIAYITFLN